MKVFSTIALLTVSEYYAISIQQAEEFLGGLLFGLIQKDDLKAIETCLTDGDQVEKEVNEAIQDFMKGDVASILAGVEVIGTLLTELPEDLKDCQDIQGDLTRISNWVKSLEANPTQFLTTVAQNVVHNFGSITREVQKTRE